MEWKKLTRFKKEEEKKKRKKTKTIQNRDYISCQKLESKHNHFRPF